MVTHSLTRFAWHLIGIYDPPSVELEQFLTIFFLPKQNHHVPRKICHSLTSNPGNFHEKPREMRWRKNNKEKKKIDWVSLFKSHLESISLLKAHSRETLEWDKDFNTMLTVVPSSSSSSSIIFQTEWRRGKWSPEKKEEKPTENFTLPLCGIYSHIIYTSTR